MSFLPYYYSRSTNYSTNVIIVLLFILATILTTISTISIPITNAFIIPIQYHQQNQQQICTTYSSFSTQLYPNYPASKSTIHPAPKFRFKDTVTTRLPSPNVPINTVDVDTVADTSSSLTTNGSPGSDNTKPVTEIHPVQPFRFKRIVNKIFRRSGNN